MRALQCAAPVTVQTIRMRYKKLAPMTLGLLLTACAEPEPLLNSERITAEFGNFGIDVISQANGVRRSDLFSTDGTGRITRTYAVVLFDAAPYDEIADEHAQILGGGSIGETFKASGWEVAKTTRYVGMISLDPDPFAIANKMHLENGSGLAMHVYQLKLRKASQSVDYATIVEVHHPAFMDLDELQSLYPIGGNERAGDSDLQAWRSLLLSRDSANAMHD